MMENKEYTVKCWLRKLIELQRLVRSVWLDFPKSST